MAGHDIVVVGASVGGVEALSSLVAQLPEDLAATLFVVQHTLPTARSQMAQILDRAGPLTATLHRWRMGDATMVRTGSQTSTKRVP